jgi:hypothetical protein
MLNHIEEDAWEGFTSWNHILANPRIKRDGSSLSWDNRVSKIIPDHMSPGDFLELIESRQYSFQNSIDGGVFQVYYCISPRTSLLSSARLAYYYPIHKATTETTNDESMNDEPIVDANVTTAESQSEPDSIGWLRLDYDPNNSSGLFHSTCHRHVGGFPSARLPVKGVPSTSQFIEFILCFVYPEEFKRHRLNEDGEYHAPSVLRRLSKPVIAMEDECCTDMITHLRTAGA